MQKDESKKKKRKRKNKKGRGRGTAEDMARASTIKFPKTKSQDLIPCLARHNERHQSQCVVK
jgi:hypothetical protein